MQHTREADLRNVARHAFEVGGLRLSIDENRAGQTLGILPRGQGVQQPAGARDKTLGISVQNRCVVQTELCLLLFCTA